MKYYEKAMTKCSCGAVHKIAASREKMEIEICSKCHPFYTGEGKIVDTAGRVERFKKLVKQADAKRAA